MKVKDEESQADVAFFNLQPLSKVRHNREIVTCQEVRWVIISALMCEICEGLREHYGTLAMKEHEDQHSRQVREKDLETPYRRVEL